MKRILGIILLSIILLIFVTPTYGMEIKKDVDEISMTLNLGGLEMVKAYIGEYIFPIPQNQDCLRSLYRLELIYIGDYIFPVPLNELNKYIIENCVYVDLPLVIPLNNKNIYN